MEEVARYQTRLEKLLTDAIAHYNLSTHRETLQQVGSPSCFATLFKVKVNGTRSDGSQVIFYWLMKAAPKDKSRYSHTEIIDWFNHTVEGFAYRTLLPAFKKFQEIPFDAYPKLVAQHSELTKEILILEAPTPKGYVMRDRKEPLDFNHLEKVVGTYAEFHAISLAMRHQQPLEFQRLHEEYLRNAVGLEVVAMHDDMVTPLTTRILKLCEGDQYREHRRWLKRFEESYVDVLAEGKLDKLQDEYSVFCHGESILCNILFEYGDKTKPNVPTKVCLIDFQMLRYGSPIFDLSYFIFTATDKATRDEHYDQLIDIYYREVCMRLEQMGSPPAVVFPYDKFQLRLKRFSVLGYFMAQMALYTMLRAPSIKVTDQMTEAEIKESMERNIVESEALYDERIKGMLIDFVEKGYFDFLDEEYPDMEFDESTTDSTDDNMVDEEDL